MPVALTGFNLFRRHKLLLDSVLHFHENNTICSSIGSNNKTGTVVKVKKTSDEIAERDQVAKPMLIELSPTAKTNLKMLQLRSLDRRGRQPDPSEIIEKLINAAAVHGPDAPYPR